MSVLNRALPTVAASAVAAAALLLPVAAAQAAPAHIAAGATVSEFQAGLGDTPRCRPPDCRYV
jgi:hypothetical protein